jgi:tRNA(fMet)-specific endonuclease VapC
MASYLLDTNHASPLVTAGHALASRLLQQLTTGDTFAICVPMLAELIFGIGILPRAVQNRATCAQLQPLFPCYVPDASDAVFAADLQIALRRQGRQLATVDALVAAIALGHDLVLLTSDADFGSVPQLRQENWLFTP